MSDIADISDRVELCLRGIGGVATIAEFLTLKFGNDVEIGPAAQGLSVLADDTRDRLDEVAEALHDGRQPPERPFDPHVDWGRKHGEAYAAIDAKETPEDVARRLTEEAHSIERSMAETRAVSDAGVAAQLRCVLASIRCQHGDEGDAPMTKNWIGALALAVESLEARQ